MKQLKIAVGVAMVLATSTSVMAGYDDSVSIDEFRDVESSYKLRASDIIGRDVVNKGDDEIGEVDDILIGNDNDIQAVLSVGGILGLGEKHVLVPYDKLRLGRDDDVVYYDSSEEALEAQAEFIYNEGELPGVETMAYLSDEDTDDVDLDINWKVVDANWDQFKAEVKQKWGELTDDDWAVIEGKRDEVVARLQEVTGRSEAQVSEEVNEIVKSLN